MKTKICAVLATVGLVAFAFAALDGYTLKPTLKVGDTHRYKQTGKFDVGGQELDIEAVATEKIVSVDPSGKFSEEESTSEFKINGQDPPAGAGGGNTTTTYSAKGEVIEIKGDNVDANVYRFSNLSLFILPDKAVSAGDVWTYDVKPDPKLSGVAAKATYTFVGEDKVGSTDTLKVKYSIKETSSDGASSEGTVWIRKSDFTMVKLSGKLTNAPAPGAPVSLTGDITLMLIQ